MNRRQKIIISVTGIFLVMLILVGLTYAYFLTQITGNTKDKSISVTTANLIVRYEDGTNIILDETTKLKPSSNAIGTKTFEVVNEGDEVDYVVIVDNISIKNATTGESTTFKTNDFVYTLECVSSDGNDCSDVKTQSTLPLKNESILIGNRMKSGVRHTYTLTLWYLDNGSDQSDDMNKTLDVRINIEDIRRLDNPYKDNTNSLAYNIINNSINAKNGTQLMAYPPSKVASEISLENWEYAKTSNIYLSNDTIEKFADTQTAIENCYYGHWNEETVETVYDCSETREYTSCTKDMEGKYYFDTNERKIKQINKCEQGKIVIGTKKYEKDLSITQDDDGISYYYRGNVSDNYVTFADMCWRIVRVDGNGNTKLILEDQDEPCSETMNGNWDIEASDGTNITMNTSVTPNVPYRTGNYGYEPKNVYIMNYLTPVNYPNRAMVNAFKYFQTKTLKDKISSEYEGKIISDYLVSGNWCLNDKAYSDAEGTIFLENIDYSLDFYEHPIYYDSYVRLYGKTTKDPVLKCTVEPLYKYDDNRDGKVSENETDMYVATLTADEVAYAGGKVNSPNLNFYLLNDNFKNHINREFSFWLLSPSMLSAMSDWGFSVSNDYSLGTNVEVVYDNPMFRPAVNLQKNIEIVEGGEGTKDNPYVIK